MQDEVSVVVVGSTMIDMMVYAGRLPQAGETVVGDRFAIGFGGKGANQAVMARLLGARVSMVNCVGDDSYGSMTRENFMSAGVDVTHLHTGQGASGVAQIWVEPGGGNRIIIVPGANHELTEAQAREAVAGSPRVDVVVGQLEIPQPVTTAAFEAARLRGAVTLLNPAPAAPLSPGLLAASDWLVPNETEFACIVGEPPTDAGILALEDRTDTRVVVTLGEAGAAWVEGGQVRRVAAPRVEAVDTTGAGDAFVGAFAVGLARGMPVEAAVALGVARASDSVTRPGTQASYRS